MRVLGRAAVLGFLVAVCAAVPASAASINIGTQGLCPAQVVATSCSLFDLGRELSSPGTVDIANHEDVLLLQFDLEFDSFFSVATAPFNTSETLGPLLGVFNPISGGVVTQGDIRALGEIISPSNPSDPAFTPFLLEQGTYLLAVLSPRNLFGGAFLGGAEIESIFATFSNDDEAFHAPCQADEGCGFSLAFSVSSAVDPAPVPEPGTLTLMAGGAIAGLIQRRRAKRRARIKSISG
jgi:hypothetical protein